MPSGDDIERLVGVTRYQTRWSKSYYSFLRNRSTNRELKTHYYWQQHLSIRTTKKREIATVMLIVDVEVVVLVVAAVVVAEYLPTRSKYVSTPIQGQHQHQIQK